MENPIPDLSRLLLYHQYDDCLYIGPETRLYGETEAVVDGLMLTPLQAIWVGLGLYIVMPTMFSKEAYHVLKPHWIFAVGLSVSFLVSGYCCVCQIPFIF